MADDSLPPFDLETEPLDDPEAWGHDWGGDGTDLMRPVRAHVLQTLRVETEPYTKPVSQLLSLGDARDAAVQKQAQQLTFSQDDLPELLRMSRDRGLYTADGDTDEVWAYLYAIQALNNLDVSRSASELIPLLDLQDDWLDTELPQLFARIGEPALEPLHAYIDDQTRWYIGRSIACDALKKITELHPELREHVIDILKDVLLRGEHEFITTSAMGTLANLKATETLPLIRQAFEQGQIDEMHYGSWGDVLQMIGVEPDPDDPLVNKSHKRFQERHEQFMPQAKRDELLGSLRILAEREREKKEHERQITEQRNAAQGRKRSEKNKRKASSAARKANKRKRK